MSMFTVVEVTRPK
jgi:hypothetical protein